MANTTFTGLFTKQVQEAFKKDIHSKIKNAVKKQFTESFKEIKKDLEVDVKVHFKIKKQSFAKAFGNKIYSSSDKVLPSMVVYAKLSKIMDIFEGGGAITAKKNFMFIPAIRIGPKAFKEILTILHNTNSLFYKNVGGKLCCLATVTPLNKQALVRFKAQQRRSSGVKSIKLYQQVLIATLVKKVDIKQRLNLHTILKNHTEEICKKALEKCRIIE